ncbi:hypothetical protein [Streptomyces sparsogenes]|nr:hypothetical protein [Streptomyces sparsogenes]
MASYSGHAWPPHYGFRQEMVAVAVRQTVAGALTVGSALHSYG